MRFARSRLVVGVLVGVAAACASSSMPPETAECGSRSEAEAVVCRFYDTVLESGPVGLPTPRQQQALAPYLTSALLDRLDSARRSQQAFEGEHPEEKPPFADGSLFTSLFEGADRFEILGSESRPGDSAAVTVRFGYEDAPTWEDTVIVVREGSRYAIDDIVFSGAGAFNPSGRLSELLGRVE